MHDRVKFSLEDLTCICVPDIQEELTEIYRKNRWVYEAFASLPSVEMIQGRRPLVCGNLGTREIIVKRLHHGGILAPVTRDRFWGISRLTGALESEDYLNGHAIRTAVTEFVSWRRVRGFIRCETGIRRLENGGDASKIFFPATGRQSADWKAWAVRLGEVVKRLHEVDFIHPDLNLMNFYFTHDENIVILDLDKGQVPHGTVSEERKQKNFMRLLRSVRKQGALFPGLYVESVVTVIEEAFRK